MAALLTKRSIGPNRRSVSATHRSTSLCCDTSPINASPPIAFATERTWTSVRPVTAIRIPAAANSRATASPMPPPPVTNPTFPSNGTTESGPYSIDRNTARRFS
jgi:hypothetical protein